MAKAGAKDWQQFVKSQPEVTEADRAPGAAPKAASFTIELAGDNLLLKIRREDGLVALVELTPDTALYLREYLSNGLAAIGVPRAR